MKAVKNIKKANFFKHITDAIYFSFESANPVSLHEMIAVSVKNLPLTLMIFLTLLKMKLIILSFNLKRVEEKCVFKYYAFLWHTLA